MAQSPGKQDNSTVFLLDESVGIGRSALTATMWNDAGGRDPWFMFDLALVTWQQSFCTAYNLVYGRLETRRRGSTTKIAHLHSDAVDGK